MTLQGGTIPRGLFHAEPLIYCLTWSLVNKGLCREENQIGSVWIDHMPEEQVAKNLPDAAKKRMMIYRDRNDKTIFLLGLFPKNKGKNLLLVLEQPDAKQTLHAIIDLNTRGERETKLEEMLKTLQSGDVPEEAPD